MKNYEIIDTICRVVCLFPLSALLIDVFFDFSIQITVIFIYLSQIGLWYVLPYLLKKITHRSRHILIFGILIYPIFVPIITDVLRLSTLNRDLEVGPMLLAVMGPMFIGAGIIAALEYYDYSKLEEYTQEDYNLNDASQVIRYIANNNNYAITLRMEYNFNGAISVWRRSLVDLESVQNIPYYTLDIRTRLNFEIESIKKNIKYSKQDFEEFTKTGIKGTSKFFRKLDVKKKKALSEEIEGNFRGALRIWNRSLASLEQKSSDRITFRMSERIMDEIRYIKTKIDINTDEVSKFPRRKFRKDIR